MPYIKVIIDSEQLPALGGSWEALYNELGDSASAFSSFTWYETWWRHYSADASLNLLVMWDADRLVGIAPLMKTRSSLHGLPVSKICFIENRNSLHNDFIVLPEYREIFLREVLTHLSEQNTNWDVILFNNLPPTSPNYESLVKILDEERKQWQQGPSFDSPYLNPSGTWSDYLASRSPRTRKSLRNIQNNIHKAGEVSVKNITTWEEFQLVREDLYQVAELSWTGQIGDSLATPINHAFFDDLACSAAAKGWLSVWILSLNGKMVAFEFHLKACSREHAMRGSYLPEFAHLSPGTYLEMEILKHVFDESEQVQKYDFGGCFDSYKRKWTDVATPHCELSIFNDSFYSRLLLFHETKTVPMIKYFRDAIKHTTAE